MLSVTEARTCIREACRFLDAEQVGVGAATDRVLAVDVLAATDVPPFACSAMDGYAVRAGASSRRLTVVAEARAGAPTDRRLADGEAIRISTGAAIPDGADAVIRQEDAEDHGSEIFTRASTASGANVRQAGEDMRAGTPVLRAGTRLGAAELGAAVAAGAGMLEVGRRPRVSVLCTGDELRAAGEPLGPGEIHNSNAVMLTVLAERCGGQVLRDERLPDDLQATEQALSTALADCDVVIVSGGVSVGPHDHVKTALERLGVSEQFWRVALQPGKPTWFGTTARTLVFGLPGNPVSAFVTFTLFAAPALRALQGESVGAGEPQSAALATAIRLNPAREQALRVRLDQQDGGLVAHPNGPQGSHIISSLLGADALAMIPRGDHELAPGTSVQLEAIPR